MKILSSKEKEKLKSILKSSKDPLVQSALRKLTEKTEKKSYANDNKTIKSILKKGFSQKRNIKIKYYSLSSDETRYRIVSIYELGDEWIIAYCHLRKEERTFVTKRILAAALLKDKYEIPKGWKAKNRVWNS